MRTILLIILLLWSVSLHAVILSDTVVYNSDDLVAAVTNPIHGNLFDGELYRPTGTAKTLTGNFRDRFHHMVFTLCTNPNVLLTEVASENYHVRVHIKATYLDESSLSKQKEFTLQINYRTNGDSSYLSKNEFMIDSTAFISWDIDHTEIFKDNGQPFSSVEIQNCFMLRCLLQTDRYWKPIETNKVPVFSTTEDDRIRIVPTSDQGYLNIIWHSTPWAEYYELEYTYCDDYTKLSLSQKRALYELQFNFRTNAVRIQITDTVYKMPVIFESGYLLYRVRPVGFWGADLKTRVPGAWSLSNSKSHVPTTAKYYFKIASLAVHENDQKNWQLITSFCEEEKQKNVVAYADGTSRVRQVQTNLSSDSLPFIAETMYDYQGRPTVEFLPAPYYSTDYLQQQTATPIKYRPNFNRNNTGNSYSKTDFDFDPLLGCQSPASGAGVQDGAGRYYSPSNPYKVNQQGWVADAEHFPFSQIEYTPDATGRIARQSIPGRINRLGNGIDTTHETKMFYGTPSQDELDMMFGNDVGYNTHYKKTIAIDPNGQSRIIYSMLNGKVLATALAGEAPASLDSLEARTRSTMLIRLNEAPLNKYNEPDHSWEAQYVLPVSYNTRMVVAYSLGDINFLAANCHSQPNLCYDCIYDLQLIVRDNCGHQLLNVSHTIGTLDSVINCHSNNAFTFADTLNLSIGEYSIYKRLASNREAINKVVEDYLSRICVEELVEPVPAETPPCGENCNVCNFNMTTITYNGTTCILPLLIDTNGRCNFFCSETEFNAGSCLAGLSKMLNDLMPCGQYGDTVDSPLSVYTESPGLEGNWRQPVTGYHNVDGSDAWVRIPETGDLDFLPDADTVIDGAIYVRPESLSHVDDFIRLISQNKSWIYSLLPYHPDFCYYQYCLSHSNIFEWESNLRNVHTYVDAVVSFSVLTDVNSTNDADLDPLFTQYPAEKTHMLNVLDSISFHLSGRTDPVYNIQQLALLATSGMNESATTQNVSQYLNIHTVYGDPSSRDAQWEQYKNYYLQARQMILDNLRDGETGDECSSQHALIADPDNEDWKNKTPVFPTHDGALQVIENAADANGFDSNPLDNKYNCTACGTSTESNRLLMLLNIEAHEHTLSNQHVLANAELQLIPDSEVNVSIVNALPVDWHPTNNGNISMTIEIGDANVMICSIELFCDSGLFNFSDIVAFSCLYDTVLNPLPDGIAARNCFRVEAILNDRTIRKLHGYSSCFNISDCNSKPDKPEIDHTCIDTKFTRDFKRIIQSFARDENILYRKSTHSNIGFINSQNALPYNWHRMGPFASLPLITDQIYATIDNPVRRNKDLYNVAIYGKYSIGKYKKFEELHKKPVLLGRFSMLAKFKLKDIEEILEVTPYRYKEDCDGSYLRIIVRLKNKKKAELTIWDFYYYIGDRKFKGYFTDCCRPVVKKPKQPEFDMSQICCLPFFPAANSLVDPPPSCEDLISSTANDNHDARVIEIISHLSDSIRYAYTNYCMQHAFNLELAQLRYDDLIYQYTLYYYDQAGNLIQTVPPKGVHLVTDTAAVRAYRNDHIGIPVTPSHSFKSTYLFNTQNEITSATNPDGGTTQHCYDELGRIIFSQDDLQKDSSKISFTAYDSLGRVAASGIMRFTGVITPRMAYSAFAANYLNNLASKQSIEEYTISYYSDQHPQTDFDPISRFQDGAQRNTYNRVSSMAYYQKPFSAAGMLTGAYDHACFYSYDLHGYVRELLQDNRFIENKIAGLNVANKLFHRLKSIAYRYDLISGKVNLFIYQQNKPDQFWHRYDYDADNRLIAVRTGTASWEDPAVQEIDARYIYYHHGPLARLEIGAEKIQGIDQYYTIQGWTKGVNSVDTTGTIGTDPGLDGDPGTSHADFAKDAYGFLLRFNDDDYSSIATGYVAPETNALNLLHESTAPGNDLFDGNITAMHTRIDGLTTNPALQSRAFRYDQLNRLKTSAVFRNDANLNPHFENAFKEEFRYDANSNFITVKRNYSDGTALDDLEYHYNNPDNNQVNYLDDHVSATPFNGDLEQHASVSNYTYDKKGRMISDSSERISSTHWNQHDRVTAFRKGTDTISYAYNCFQQRIGKQVDGETMYYVRDLTGNILSVYEIRNDTVIWNETPLYGTQRLGVQTMNKLMQPVASSAMDSMLYFRGQKQYELSNHLGNVLSVVSDMKHKESDVWKTELVSTNDYYAFGMLMPGRSGGSEYAFRFNGKENNNEVKGKGNNYDFGDRSLDPRIGRWLSADALACNHPSSNPYNTFGNNPILNIDPDGNEDAPTHSIRLLHIFGLFEKKEIYQGNIHNGWYLDYAHDPKKSEALPILKSVIAGDIVIIMAEHAYDIASQRGGMGTDGYNYYFDKQKYYETYRLITADDMVSSFKEPPLIVVLAGCQTKLELNALRKSGAKIYILTEDDQEVSALEPAIQVLLNDLTSGKTLKQAVERANQSLAGSGFVIFDKDGGLRSANPTQGKKTLSDLQDEQQKDLEKQKSKEKESSSTPSSGSVKTESSSSPSGSADKK
jgi:RHS repeat-associated protein